MRTRAERKAFRAEWKVRTNEWRIRIGHRSWMDYYLHVRSAGGVAGKPIAFMLATVAYISQTIRLK